MKSRPPPHLNQVVKVVLPPYPAVVGLETVGFVGDVFSVQALTVVELPFEQLERENGQRKKGGKAPSAVPQNNKPTCGALSYEKFRLSEYLRHGPHTVGRIDACGGR